MSETKFTPGPWKIVTTKQEGIIPNFHIQIGEDQISVFPYKRIYSEDRTQSGLVFDEEKVANINLIAAAPDMYAELEAAMNVFRFYQGHHAAKGHSDKEQTNKQYADRIAKVLAKARGEA